MLNWLVVGGVTGTVVTNASVNVNWNQNVDPNIAKSYDVIVILKDLSAFIVNKAKPAGDAAPMGVKLPIVAFGHVYGVIMHAGISKETYSFRQ